MQDIHASAETTRNNRIDVVTDTGNAGASVKESTDTVKWRKMIDIYHQKKHLELDHRVEAVACHQ